MVFIVEEVEKLRKLLKDRKEEGNKRNSIDFLIENKIKDLLKNKKFVCLYFATTKLFKKCNLGTEQKFCGRRKNIFSGIYEDGNATENLVKLVSKFKNILEFF